MYDETAEIEAAELGEVWNGNATAAEAVERMKPDIEAVLESGG